MSKRPADRFESAVAFAMALQEVELSLGHNPTRIEVRDAVPHVRPRDQVDADDETNTRLRRITEVRAQPQPQPRSSVPPPPSMPRPPDGAPHPPEVVTGAPKWSVPPSLERDRVGGRGEPAMADTQMRVTGPSEPLSQSTQTGAPPRPAWLVVGALVSVVLAVVGVLWIGSGDAPQTGAGPAADTETTPANPADALVDSVPSPIDLTSSITSEGDIEFVWSSSDPQEGDQFLWQRTDAGAPSEVHLVDESRAVVTAVEAGAAPCIEVSLRRSNGRTSATPVRGCHG